MQDEKTTTLIVNMSQLDTLIIALSDSKDACQRRLEYCKAAKYEMSLEKNPDPKLDKEVRELEALSQFTLDNIPGILAEIREVYQELEEREDESKRIVIAQPSWKNPIG